LIFSAADGTSDESARKSLLAFAREVNDALAQLGFPLCIGGIMASNPAWCLSADEWRSQFTSWLVEPTPAALLNANIFFDFRPLAGEARLAAELRSWLLARTQGNQLFLRLMVANALQTEPPLGLIRAFAVEEKDGMIDLKTRGTRIFVDAARVFALAEGIAETGTAERLRNAGSRIGAEEKHVSATIEAFHYLQVLRLRTQESASGSINRIDPQQLNEVDQRMLQEAFRQARKLQQRLQVTYARF
jgi:CBS domain-containing protein